MHGWDGGDGADGADGADVFDGGGAVGGTAARVTMNDSFLLQSFGGPVVPLHAPSSHYAAAASHASYGASLAPSLAPSASMAPVTSRQYQRHEQDERSMASVGDPVRHAGRPSAGRGRSLDEDLPAYLQHASTPRSTSPPSRTSPGTASYPKAAQRHSPTPPWVQSVLAAAGASNGRATNSLRDSTLLALECIFSARVAPSVLSPQDDVPSIVDLLSGSPMSSAVDDSLAVVSALHVLASDERCRDAIVDANGLEALTYFTANSASNVHLSGDENSSGGAATTRAVPLQTTLSRPAWDAAVRTMSKLVVFSGTACRRALEGGALAILAAAALPSEPIDTRVRAAAGIAAISSWSGPRGAVDVLETPNVIAAMAGVLTDEDSRVLPHLRRATLDGLNVMAHRRRARIILKEAGCNDFISFAARQASVSGDHDIAARSTVVAGQMTGHSVDEFGFLVENDRHDPTNRASGVSSEGRPSLRANHGRDSDVDGSTLLYRRETGLAIIQTELLKEEGFTSCEDIDALAATVGHHVGAVSNRPSVDVACVDPDADSRHSLDQACLAQSSGDAFFAAKSEDPDEDVVAMSPLSGFTAATERAAARGSAGTQKKSESQLAKDAKSERVWENVLANRPEDLEREKNDGFGRVRAYRDLAGIPIPTKLRAVVWPKLLDVEGLRRRKPGLYEALCAHGGKEALPEDIEHTIEADLTRTMPFHCLFWQSGAAPGIVALRRVLRAYAFHVPSVGYCQGMSSIAALILLNSPTEEDAFLMLVRFLSRYGFKNVYKPGFPQYKQWVEELRGVIAARMPTLTTLFEREGVMPELFLDKSIISCLTHNYPHRALVRVWDLMFLGGSPKIILKACLAVLVLSEKKLMSMNFEDMVTYLQRGFADPGAGIVDDDQVESFLDVARSVKLTTEPLPQPSAPAPPQRQNPPAQKKSRNGCFSCFGGKRKEE